MSRIKLVLDVINDMRSLADSLSELATEMSDVLSETADTTTQLQKVVGEKTVDNTMSNSETEHKTASSEEPKATIELVRGLAAKLAKSGKREEVKQLVNSYGVENITSINKNDLDTFYSELLAMEVDTNGAN